MLKAIKEYKNIKKEAKTKRITFLEKKAKIIAEDIGGEKQNIYKRIITRERQREAARRIKLALKKNHKSWGHKSRYSK